ncbi:hypothetical protein GCM10007853_09660 [Algimonas ampicilliniresistens]|uniref:Uncharacterized protein n=1 Tax=Algimonas ampicilliniresistens TaxID=1298735 RepID=A0ABQ5V9R3_9PROT|nr:hypothetical protein GCM10007853_09660 [Algimonas ampicilliniresistens]
MSVRVGNDELDTIKTGINHIIDGVPACPTNAYDDDAWLEFDGLGHFECN